MKTNGILLAVAVVLLPLSANAEGYSATTQEKFNKLDTNHDGYISQAEAKSHAQLMQKWSTTDANKDGKIEESEFSAFEEDMMSKKMMK